MQKYLKYIIPLGLIFVLAMSIITPYNSLTTKQENVNQAQAKIETQLIFVTNTHAIDLPNRPDNGIYDPSHYLNETVAQNLANANKNNDTQIGVYIVDNID